MNQEKIVKDPKRILDVIAHVVAKRYGVTIKDVKSKSRHHPEVIARMFMCWIGNQVGVHYRLTARFLGKDSTLPDKNSKTVQGWIDSDPRYAEDSQEMLDNTWAALRRHA